MTNASHFSLLVVDDEPDLRTLYELTLLREGYDLDTAGTVQERQLVERAQVGLVVDDEQAEVRCVGHGVSVAGSVAGSTTPRRMST